MRVPAYLTYHRVPFETLIYPPAFTAQKRAKFLHLSGKKVAKSVLLAGADGYLLAILPATLQVDTNLLAAAVGGPVRLASRQEVVNVFRDCEWGVVPPFGSLYGLPTVLDTSFDLDALIVFESHTHGEDVRLSCRDFARLESPICFSFARPVS
jgi:Ala-tRNA(Pro) deacylase